MAIKKQIKNTKNITQPSVVIKPLGKFGGLDGIHIALIILIALTLAFLLYISFARQSIVILTNQTQSASDQTICHYGYLNNSCITPIHNSSEILHIFEQYIAGYSSINGAQSLIPFISNVSMAKVYYIPYSHSWLVTVPERNINSNVIFNISAIINDINTSEVIPFIQTIKPNNITNNFVAGNGYLKINDTISCSNSTTTPVYWFIDPYSAGGISSLYYLENLSQHFGSKISPTLEILYTQSSQEIADTYGLTNATLLGKYLFCSSQQGTFDTFASTLNSSYKNLYLNQQSLQQLAKNSGLNMSELSTCIASAGTIINRQAILAKHYNITSSPSVLIGCQYLAIPQTAYQSICSINNNYC